jgi:hypothetical protein
MYKLAPTRADAPDQAYWVTLDADGHDLPSDWYLRLSGCITCAMQGRRAISDTIPIQPGGAWADSAACWDMSMETGEKKARAARPEISVLRVSGGLLFKGAGHFASLKIMDLPGNVIREYDVPSGNLVWDFMDGSGRRASGGVYLAVLAGKGRTGCLKILVH